MNIISQLSYIIQISQKNLMLSFLCVAILWGVYFFNFLLGRRLLILGIIPREAFGLIGIPCSPFLHSNISHLFFNSIPLFILSNLLLIYGVAVFIHLSIIIALLSGVLVWLFGRKAIHVGASGVIMGYWSFLLVNAYLQSSAMSWLLGGLCLYFLAGMALNLFPRDARTSWEAHVFGALAGVVAIWMI